MDYRIGMVLTGRVTGIQPYGAFVLLDDNTQGLIHISELKHGFISDVSDYLKVGQMVKVMAFRLLQELRKKFRFQSYIGFHDRHMLITNLLE